jgi:hypothetical protein
MPTSKPKVLAIHLVQTPNLLYPGAIPPTPTELTADASNFLYSLKRLLRLLLSSAAFRTIVSDILSTARELVADVAADISNVALHVQISAEQVEEAARLDSVALERLKAKTQEAAGKVQDAGSARQRRRTVSQDPTKDIIVGRIQAVSEQTEMKCESLIQADAR